MDSEKLKQFRIDPQAKARPKGSFRFIIIVVVVVLVVAGLLAFATKDKRLATNASASPGSSAPAAVLPATNSASTAPGNAVLTVSGYIINRERIEISPRFQGVVKWIGVKKGDAVTNGQVVVLLDDTEYQARTREAEGRVATARANVTRAELEYARVNNLSKTDIESKQAEDDARLQLEANRAALKETEGALEVATTYLGWCTIRSPINGVVLEKLVDPNELVVPVSYGGTRGPSTALIAVADPKDLQVEIDLNESDLSKVSLNQKCRVSPEAYPGKVFGGYVAEIAPEADRSKGTLQIKVQIVNPDKFLTPELSAKVEFLK
jgi:HlyD family secretion protein